MVWTTKRNAIVAAIGALLLIVIVWILIPVLKGPSPGTQDSAESNFVPPPSSGSPTATNSLPLEGFYTMPASSFTADNTFAWPGLPRDVQVFSGVRFHVDGSAMLGGGTGFQEQYHFQDKRLDIPVHQKFASLYVFHFAEWSDPPGTPVYDLVLRYEDGSSVTNEIEYGTDIYDFYAPPNDIKEPSGENSMVAWRGHFTVKSGVNQALRAFVTELKNSKPSVEVVSLDLFSCKNKSVGCVLAITAGPSGLVHKP
jgi:hypothetical protein